VRLSGTEKFLWCFQGLWWVDHAQSSERFDTVGILMGG
jgi:hypothetical protein